MSTIKRPDIERRLRRKDVDAPWAPKPEIANNATEELKSKFGKKRSPDFLTNFLMKIYAERGIGWNQLNGYIGQHLRDVADKNPNRSAKKLGTDRGNILKELERGSMTFRNFMGKLKLIRIRKVKFALLLDDGINPPTYHETDYIDATIPMAMGDEDDFDEDSIDDSFD